MNIPLGFLIWLLCVGVSAIVAGYFLKYGNTMITKKEGFKMMKACPSGSRSFITHDGYTHCCNGDTINNMCSGNIVCTLSDNKKTGIPMCDEVAKAAAAAKGQALCPGSLPNYFSSNNLGLQGCSLSPATVDGTNPLNPDDPQCILYPTQALDEVKLDSCYNFLQNAQKSISCTKALESSLVIASSYSPSQGNLLVKNLIMPIDYKLSFDLTPTGIVSNAWASLIHFSANKDYGALGDRAPGIWFSPNSITTFAVHIGSATEPDWAARPSEMPLAIGKKTHLDFVCIGQDITITVDGKVYKYKSNPNRYTGPLKVFGSSPWYPPAQCLIENVSLRGY